MERSVEEEAKTKLKGIAKYSTDELKLKEYKNWLLGKEEKEKYVCSFVKKETWMDIV